MAATPLVVIGPDGPRPFMRGIMVQSLVSRGIPFDVAVDTAKRVEELIRDRDRLDRAELARLVERLLGDRYDLEAVPLHPGVPTVRSMSGSATPFSKGILAVSLQGAALDLGEGRPIFVLIGGSSGVGKSSVAVEAVRRLELARVIGTDSIRQIMRLMFSADLMPEIHCSTYDAYRALRPAHAGTRDPLILGYREQAQRITVGVHALLDRALEENTSMVVEGVNLVPGLLDLERYRGSAHVVFLVLATLDLEAFRDRFRARAAQARERSPDRYLEHIDAILAIQEYILSEADHFGLPIIDNVHFDQTVRSAIRTAIASIQKADPPLAETSKEEAPGETH
jgi:2-phosphoglycerate kinase